MEQRKRSKAFALDLFWWRWRKLKRIQCKQIYHVKACISSRLSNRVSHQYEVLHIIKPKADKGIYARQSRDDMQGTSPWWYAKPRSASVWIKNSLKQFALDCFWWTVRDSPLAPRKIKRFHYLFYLARSFGQSLKTAEVNCCFFNALGSRPLLGNKKGPKHSL